MVPHQLRPDLGPQPRPDRPGRHPHRPGRTPLATHRYTRLTVPGTTGAARASSQAPVNGHSETLALNDYLRGKVDALWAEEWWYKGAGQEQLRSGIVLYERSLDRCAKVLTDMTRLNLEDRLVIVTERQAEVVVSVIRSTLAEFGTDPDDVEGRTIVQPNLRAVGAWS
jgi:hypothetical protein